MAIEKIRIKWTGLRPLLMHAWRFVDPLDPVSIDLARITSKRLKTPADHAEISRIEWHGGLWLRDGKPCIPTEAIEATLVDAAKTVRRKRAAQAGFFCCESPLLLHPGPAEIEQLWADPAYRLRYPVRVNSVRTMRTRPRFPEWSVVFEAEFVPTVLSRSEVLEFMQIAGFCAGVGDWRPKFGRFEAVEA